MLQRTAIFVPVLLLVGYIAYHNFYFGLLAALGTAAVGTLVVFTSWRRRELPVDFF